MRYQRHRYRRGAGKRRILLLLLLALCTWIFAEARLPGVKANVQQATLRQFALEKIADTMESTAPENLSDVSGSVALDTYALGTWKASLTASLSDALSGTAVAWVPLGNLSGIAVLNGHGPKIPVFFSVEGLALVELHTELESAGINRTRYGVTAEISAELYSASVAFSDVITLSTSYPLFEAVVQGEVPRYASGVFAATNS